MVDGKEEGGTQKIKEEERSIWSKEQTGIYWRKQKNEG